MNTDELSTGGGSPSAKSKKREGEKRTSPLTPLREKGKGKEQDRVSCETSCSKTARAHVRRKFPCACSFSEAGAAGIRICEMCKAAGVVDVTMCDSKGTIRKDRTDLNPYKARHAVDTTAKTLKEAIAGADVFIGVSAANVLSGEDVAKMGDFPAIFAMANPDPEIAPEEVAKALEGRKYVMVTGRSDYPNQVNNVLGFPYLFRGALDVGATTINMPMKVAAANALAALARLPVPEDVKTLYPDETLEFGTGYIIPKPFDRRLFVEVPFAVAEAAVKSGVTRAGIDFAAYRLNLERRNAARQSA